MENKTVGIVTINDYTNYGNRLQNYALTRLLAAEGCTVYNGIEVYTKEDWVYLTNNPVKKTIKRLIPYFLIKKRISPRPAIVARELEERNNKFRKFTSSYSRVIEPIVDKDYKHVNKFLSAYRIDYFLVGSDQVWNPYFAGRNYQFLAFVKEKNRRLSFAASIGADDIPHEKKAVYKELISEMNFLSVREDRASEIIKELTGRDAHVTLDPTLLLSKEEWNEIVTRPDMSLENNYICTYFLGDFPKAVDKFADSKGLKVYRMNSVCESELYSISPGEFLYMIKNARYVLTDSFHAVVFSIIFNVEFYVFDRADDNNKKMFSRIETITKRFGLENRVQNRNEVVEQEKIVHWEKIKDVLRQEREETMELLSKYMN